MKRIFHGLIALLLAASAQATTLNPIQLLNPTGSTSGQAILSTGASTAPAWGNVSAAALTGIVPVSNGGTNASTASGTSLDNITGFASTGFLTRTGAGAYAFQSATNGITLGNIAQVAANTLLGNATGSTANLTAVTVTGCNGAAQALQWTNASGFGCNSSIATSGANANITSLSGLTTALSVAQGGTGRATLTTHGVLVGEGTAAINQLAVGTTGQMLIGATGADPAFGNTVSTLVATSTITPSSTAGIVGTTTNDNAQAGSIGEFPTPTNLTAVSLTNATSANISSVSLTAGDYEVSGTCVFIAAASTTVSGDACGVSTTSATLPAVGSYQSFNGSITTASTNGFIAPTVRVSLASTTTVYLIGFLGFAVSTATANGYLHIRRVR